METTSNIPTPTPTGDPLEARIGELEKRVDLMKRVATVESMVKEARGPMPWWRDAKTVTIVTGLLAAAIPAATAVDGILSKAREESRIRLEQQNTIRQEYLNRVFAPGIIEGDRLRLFRLLKRISGDPELGAWANDEYGLAEARVDSISDAAKGYEQRVVAVGDSLTRLRDSTTAASTAQGRRVEAERVRLLTKADSLNQIVQSLKSRIESPTPPAPTTQGGLSPGSPVVATLHMLFRAHLTYRRWVARDVIIDAGNVDSGDVALNLPYGSYMYFEAKDLSTGRVSQSAADCRSNCEVYFVGAR